MKYFVAQLSEESTTILAAGKNAKEVVNQAMKISKTFTLKKVVEKQPLIENKL